MNRNPFSLGRFGLESRLHDYLTGECDATTRAEVEELLAKDAKARALLDEMRAAHEALLLLRDRPAPEAPLDDIRLAIASGVFAGKPQPDMVAWGSRFYKRVAAAAVLTCGVSLGFLAQQSFRADDATTATPVVPTPEPGVDVAGEISAFELMRRNNGNLVTVTPTDAVTPVIEFDPR